MDRILLVDDDTTLLKYVARCLRDNDLEVITCGCAAEAKAVLKRSQFKAIVCDHQMPGESGLELLSEVRELYPQTDCYLLSGKVSGLEIASNWAAEIGVREIFIKPCDPQEIAQRILTSKPAVV